MSKLERNIALVFALAVALLLGLGALIVFSARHTTATFRALDRSTAILRAAETVMLDLLNIQTATRGFLLTGDDNFLQPYRLGVTDIPRALAELEQTCADQPHHLSRVRRVAALQAELSELNEERLRARRAENFAPELMGQNLRSGKKRMDEIRQLLSAIEDEERAELRRHSTQMQEAAGDAAGQMALLGFSAIALVAVAGVRVLRETRSRGQAEEALRDLNRDLESRVAARTHDLALSTARLQTLSRRLLDIQETERRVLAQELHDQIGQSLTAVKITLQSLQRSPPAPEQLAARLRTAIDLAAECLAQTRSLSLNLRPPMLDDLGLVPALRWLTSSTAESAQGARVELQENLETHRPRPAVEIAAFRIAQESLTNALRHADPRHVRIAALREDQALTVTITDDGRGFDIAAARDAALQQGTSLGLAGMEERAVFAGGSLEIGTPVGGGTRVTARFPQAFTP